MFSNDDKLAERLTKAGEATGERVWRMPLGPEYDKLIDSKFADMKNTGGRWARLDHCGAVASALRRQDAMGASRHRRYRARFAADRHQQELELRLGCAPARPFGRGSLRALKISIEPDLSERRIDFADPVRGLIPGLQRGNSEFIVDADAGDAFGQRNVARDSGKSAGQRNGRIDVTRCAEIGVKKFDFDRPIIEH